MADTLNGLVSQVGGATCGQLSPALRTTLEQEHAAPRCADAVGKIKTRGSAVEFVHVYATSARLDLAGGESVFLSAMRDGWRIDALGCRQHLLLVLF